MVTMVMGRMVPMDVVYAAATTDVYKGGKVVMAAQYQHGYTVAHDIHISTDDIRLLVAAAEQEWYRQDEQWDKLTVYETFWAGKVYHRTYLHVRVDDKVHVVLVVSPDISRVESLPTLELMEFYDKMDDVHTHYSSTLLANSKLTDREQRRLWVGNIQESGQLTQLIEYTEGYNHNK